MSGRDRRAGWQPWAGRVPLEAPPATITQAIEGLTDRVVAVRVLKEKGIMSDTENQQESPAPATPLPPAPTIAAAAPPAPRPARAGSFAASLRAMMDEAREGVQRARADGLATVQSAVDDLAEAAVSTSRVSERMARTIRDEADEVRAELGQISNDL